MTGWRNPVPQGIQTRGFAPSDFYADAPMYADEFIRKAHDIENGSFANAHFYSHFHAALDIAAPLGTHFLAPQSGLVLDAKYGVPGSWANGGGYFLRVLVNEECMWLGAHFSRLRVVPGQRVQQGQWVADVGSTGVATGNHTHFWIRQGPKPYYDPQAFYYNPALLLPGGPMYGDPRFEPYHELPDTGLPSTSHRVEGDPAPMKMREVNYDRTILDNKPIRAGYLVSDPVIARTNGRKSMRMVGRIPKEWITEKHPGEGQYGDVLVTRIYDGSGHVFGHVKQVDLAGNQ